MDLSRKENRKTAKKKKHTARSSLSNPAFAMISEFCNHNFEPEKLEEEKKTKQEKK
jgi:hypothetical protein